VGQPGFPTPPPAGLRADRTSGLTRLLPHRDAPAQDSSHPSPARGRGDRGEGQPAHPNAIKPLDAHVFCPPLNARGRVWASAPSSRGLGKPGFPRPLPGGRVWAGAALEQGCRETGFPHTPPAGGFGRATPDTVQASGCAARCHRREPGDRPARGARGARRDRRRCPGSAWPWRRSRRRQHVGPPRLR